MWVTSALSVPVSDRTLDVLIDHLRDLDLPTILARMDDRSEPYQTHSERFLKAQKIPEMTPKLCICCAVIEASFKRITNSVNCVHFSCLNLTIGVSLNKSAEIWCDL